MTIKFKELEIELDDFEGLDESLDTFIKEAKVANELFFQDNIEYNGDEEELEDLIYNNLERFIHYNKHLKTDFDRAKALAIVQEEYDIAFDKLQPRFEIYMNDDKGNDFDIVEKNQKISDETKINWVVSSSSSWSLGKVLEDFFNNEEAIDDWRKYAIETLGMDADYSPYDDYTSSSNQFPDWFLNIYKYEIKNEEMVERVANESGYHIYRTEIEYKDKKYNFTWART